MFHVMYYIVYIIYYMLCIIYYILHIMYDCDNVNQGVPILHIICIMLNLICVINLKKNLSSII